MTPLIFFLLRRKKKVYNKKKTSSLHNTVSLIPRKQKKNRIQWERNAKQHALQWDHIKVGKMHSIEETAKTMLVSIRVTYPPRTRVRNRWDLGEPNMG